MMGKCLEDGTADVGIFFGREILQKEIERLLADVGTDRVDDRLSRAGVHLFEAFGKGGEGWAGSNFAEGLGGLDANEPLPVLAEYFRESCDSVGAGILSELSDRDDAAQRVGIVVKLSNEQCAGR